MKLIKCGGCGTDISPKAEKCPQCGHPNDKADHISGGQALVFIVLAIVGLWWFAGGGIEKQAASDLRQIQNQVAGDAVQQYEIAKREGNAIQTCVQAGLVSAAYLQAQDEPSYKRWKKVESDDCRRAGIPQ